MSNTDDHDDPVREHLVAAARVIKHAIGNVRQQLGEDAYAAIVSTLRGGGMARATTTISLAGAMGVTFDLVGPRGDVVNLCHVEIEGVSPTVN